MKTTIVICPFAQFGNPGTAAGAELLGDALREMQDDNRRENRPHRASAYSDSVTIREISLANMQDFANWHAKARDLAQRVLEAGDFLIWIGGNHLSVMPVYEVLANHSRPLIVQLDAHLDVYHFRDNAPELSHGNFVRHLPQGLPIINLGHRDLFLEHDEITKFFIRATSAADFDINEDRAISDLKKSIKGAKSMMLDIDADVFDPAFFPAVVDSLPFGLAPQQILRIVHAIGAKKLSALALSEFDPGRDHNDQSLGLLIWLIEYVLLGRFER